MLAHVVSCFCLFFSPFFLFLLEVQLFVCSAFFCCCFFLCREIPENVLADNYWRFHTINYNSRKSNFYDSHAQREVTLAESENTTMMAAVYRWEWTDILTHVVCVCARVCWSFLERGVQVPMPEQWRTAEPRAETLSGNLKLPHNLGLTDESPCLINTVSYHRR